MAIQVEQIGQVTSDVVEAFARLVPQLSSVLEVPTQERLQAVVGSGHAMLFCARLDGVIVGILTLAWYDVPSGRKAWIEDVVVDAAARGCGAGVALVLAAVDQARTVGAERLMLYSSRAREAAHALYHKTGFGVAESTLFWMKIEK